MHDTDYRRARRAALTLGMAIGVCAATAPGAHAAAACDAPWMHTGGGFTTTFTPGRRTVAYTVTRFAKRDGENCDGDVHAVMKMSMGGQPMRSESDLRFSIADGKTVQPARRSAGALHASGGAARFDAVLSAQTSGILSYVGEITHEGQRLAGTRTEGSMSGTVSNTGHALGALNVPTFVTTTSDKTVGKAAQLRTPAGTFECWPVAYERAMQASHAQLASHTVNLSMKSRVVDHFCPATGLVMREDTTVNGKTTSMTVGALH